MEVQVYKKFSEDYSKVKLFVRLKLTETEVKAIEYVTRHEPPLTEYDYVFYRVAYNIFYKQKNLYEAMNISNYDNYHPSDTTFNNRCDGFKQFLNEIFNVNEIDEVNEAQMNQIAQAFVNFINNCLQRYNEALNTYVSTNVITTTVTQVNQNQNLQNLQMPEIQLQEKALIVTPQGTFKVSLIPVAESKNLQELTQEITKTFKNIYENQVNVKLQVYQQEIENLKHQIEVVKQEAFIQGLRVYNQIKANWRLNRNWLVYKKEIIPTKIKRDGKIYNIPESQQEFYVKGLKVPIEPIVAVAYVSDSYHPNINRDSKMVCLGDLEGKPLLEVLEKLPKELEMINLDSAFDDEPKETAYEIVNELEYEGESGSAVWTS